MIDLQRLRTARGVDLTAWPPRYDTAYLPSDKEEYWLPELECAGEAERSEIVFGKLTNQIRYAWERSPFYRRRWQEAGVSPDTLKSLDDLARFPVIQKAEMRVAQETNPPFGDLLCIEAEEISRIHGTSGTTGRPVVFGIGRDDWDRVANAHARIMWAAGIRPHDRIIICSFFSLYVGSWGALIGGERIRAAMFPFGAGIAGQTARAVEWALTVRPTAFYGTPSYALRFAEVERFGGEFQVVISRQDSMDELLIRAEYIPAEKVEDSIDVLRTTMGEKIRARLGLRPILELVPQGTLPRTEFKARRVIDDRDVYRTSVVRTK